MNGPKQCFPAVRIPDKTPPAQHQIRNGACAGVVKPVAPRCATARGGARALADADVTFETQQALNHRKQTQAERWLRGAEKEKLNIGNKESASALVGKPFFAPLRFPCRCLTRDHESWWGFRPPENAAGADDVVPRSLIRLGSAVIRTTPPLQRFDNSATRSAAKGLRPADRRCRSAIAAGGEKR